MITYPNLVVELAARDVDEIAAAAAVSPAGLRRVLDGGYPVPLHWRARLARVLDVPAVELFRTESVGPGHVVELDEGYPEDRFVSDPPTLRAIADTLDQAR